MILCLALGALWLHTSANAAVRGLLPNHVPQAPHGISRCFMPKLDIMSPATDKYIFPKGRLVYLMETSAEIIGRHDHLWPIPNTLDGFACCSKLLLRSR
jgi:hypothetical protein